MVSSDVARNVSQRAGQTGRVSGRIINANTGIYTVPANRRARVTDIVGVLDTVGVDATYAVAIKRAIGGGFDAITLFKVIDIEMKASEVTLETGDILTNIGDSGSTNGTFDLSATIEEFTR